MHRICFYWYWSNIFQFLNIFNSFFTLYTSLDEVAYIEIIKGKFIIEVIILKQEHGYL